ncbi:MAG: tetraacyldisaccharide 4'-kinase [Candidatus Cloacimonadales bacterium]
MDIQNLIDKHLRKRSFLSYTLAPFGILYGVVQWFRRFLYQKGVFKSYQSKIKIISVGNIVSGGSGKTPFTIYLCNLLTKQGKKVAISHRGYKGEYEQEVLFISDRKEVFELAYKAGDEPLLLAKNLPNIPIVVGRDRTSAVKLVEESYPDMEYIILDDSFQHLQVQHDYDFVVFNSGFGIGNGFVLPAGLLREFMGSLKRCTAIIWNQLDTSHVPAELLNSRKPIVSFSYESVGLFDAQDRLVDLGELNKGVNALMSGIGYPEGFEKSATDYGIQFEKHFRLSDHYDYQSGDFRTRIAKSIKDNKLNSLIITEKDYVKLQQLPAFEIPYYILKVALKSSDDEKVLSLFV